MAASVRQTVGRLILDLDLLADGQDPGVRRDTLVHMIIEIAGHLCRTEGFGETALLYGVIGEAAQSRKGLSPDDMPDILRSWHDRLLADGHHVPPPSPFPAIPIIPDSVLGAAIPSLPTTAPIRIAPKPRAGLLGRELARTRR